MSNIIFNVAALECEKPIMKDIYREGGSYKFNWSSKWDEYNAIGINATIRMFYKGDFQPEKEYLGTGLPFPGNADMYPISDHPPTGFDQTDFRFVFEIEDTCSFEFIIPYSQVITI